MSAIFYIFAILLALKLIWNMYVPISITFFWSHCDRKNKGVSLSPIEFLILFIMTALSFINENLSILGLRGFTLLCVGIAVIIFTYIFIYLIFQLFKGRFSE